MRSSRICDLYSSSTSLSFSNISIISAVSSRAKEFNDCVNIFCTEFSIEVIVLNLGLFIRSSSMMRIVALAIFEDSSPILSRSLTIFIIISTFLKSTATGDLLLMRREHSSSISSSSEFTSSSLLITFFASFTSASISDCTASASCSSTIVPISTTFERMDSISSSN